MKIDNVPDVDSFALPAQTLRGSRQEMLATIDQAIVGLLALRHLIAGEAFAMPGLHGTPAANPRRHSVPTFLAEVGRIFSNLMRQHD
jgi:hypothetical protein